MKMRWIAPSEAKHLKLSLGFLYYMQIYTSSQASAYPQKHTYIHTLLKFTSYLIIADFSLT